MNTTSQPFTGLNMHHQQQKQDPPDIFWTACPFCGLRNQYYRFLLTRSLCCLGCKRPFMAFDMNARGPSTGVKGNKSAFSQQQGVPGQGAKIRSQSTVGNPPSDVGSKGTFGTGTAEPQTFPKMGSTYDGRYSKWTGEEDGNSASQPFTSLNMHHQQQKQDPPDIFWTACPFCGLRYQYYRFVLNRSLCCPDCKRPFVAFDMNAQGQSAGVNGNQSAFSHHLVRVLKFVHKVLLGTPHLM
ncbi:uncharacterized protein LOC122091345 [Macadamia integrifolia]|uniref:uncharacterized protein LOC122091345 n=1 Tax=Macadamia integrifolia TaxID=60698 RepID=UPI001C4EB9A6|nr:uncharacterized protein LOC122091345 [Macadamia integrifolia]XP_042517158.1 uncharacterized protein LOC122091345 [Macadamia integrifolia]